MNDLLAMIRKIPDFPKPGILFYDITTVLQNPEFFAKALSALVQPYLQSGVDVVCGIESRGFIFGAAMANMLNAGFVPIRKAGKLPWKTVQQTYALEYGTDVLELHADGVHAGQNVLIVDDLLATGGTAQASIMLVNQLGAHIQGLAVMIELIELAGRSKIQDIPIHALISV